ncbi:MAG TPA: Ig-like domain-containing protein, partial [Pseudomonas sp.]|nr:Ig-like domain-containing protein [Pseudomonas sp.]
NLSAAYPKNGGPAPAGSSQLITITGGTQPYTYKSHNPGVAEVNANGLVMARGNGSTYITVTDATGLVMYIEIEIKGILELIGLSFNIYSWCKRKADDNNVTIPSLAEWEKMRADAGGNLQLELIEGKNPLVWTSTPGNSKPLGPTRIAFVFPGFELKELDDFDHFGVESGGTAHAFGMKR